MNGTAAKLLVVGHRNGDRRSRGAFLPRRTSLNPWAAGIERISAPENRRLLPSADLQRGHIQLLSHSGSDFGWIGALDEELDRLSQVCARFFDGITLARDLHL